jgi:hypothetical protein
MDVVGQQPRCCARFGALGLTGTLEVRQATEEENMYNSYLILIVADQRRRQRIAEAAAYRQAQATRPEASSRPGRPTRPLHRRLARLMLVNEVWPGVMGTLFQ